MTLTALTLHRPWDQPVADGSKPIENRPNPPPRKLLGQWIAIHAGKTYDYDGAEFIRARGYELGATDPTRAGAIVGVARIAGWRDERPKSIVVDPVDGVKSPSLIVADGIDVEQVIAIAGSPWFFGPVGILLVDARPIAPVRCRGFQGWWGLTEDVEARVREQMTLPAFVERMAKAARW